MISENAYAKLNLTLYIKGRLPDGYHELETVMQTVSLYDTVELTESDGISLSVIDCGYTCPPGRDNLAWRAAEAFFGYTGVRGGADMVIYKRIPVCGGYGGGSSDAAAVIRGLDYMYNTGLTYEHMRALASSLGADVPFFVEGGTCLCRGKGEIITRVPFNAEVYYCVCAPGAGAPTKTMFTLFDESGAPTAKYPPFMSRNASDVANSLHNDFTGVCGELCPETLTLTDLLMTCGALGASLTGSGSGVFGVFATRAEAAEAVNVLNGQGYFAAMAVPT